MKAFLLSAALAVSFLPVGFAADSSSAVAQPENQPTTETLTAPSAESLEPNFAAPYCGHQRYEWQQVGWYYYCYLMRTRWAPHLGQCEWNRVRPVDPRYCGY